MFTHLNKSEPEIYRKFTWKYSFIWSKGVYTAHSCMILYFIQYEVYSGTYCMFFSNFVGSENTVTIRWSKLKWIYWYIWGVIKKVFFYFCSSRSNRFFWNIKVWKCISYQNMLQSHVHSSIGFFLICIRNCWTKSVFWVKIYTAPTWKPISAKTKKVGFPIKQP